MTPLPWRQPLVRAIQHPIVHALFGVTMAAFARRAKAQDVGPSFAGNIRTGK